MTWLLELLVFVPAMIATNTPFPIPSDTVLLAFAGGTAHAVVFATVGAACAGIGGLAELRVADAIVEHRERPPRWFYAAVVAGAALPIPFTTIRLLLLRFAPRPVAYSTAIAIGRFPRYLGEALLVAELATPAWLSYASIAGAIVVLGVWWRLRR
jgi:membrane protein YqaA with SNARE-associated domain